MVSFSELTYWQLPQVTGVFSVVNIAVHVNMGALKATKSHYTYTNSATVAVIKKFPFRCRTTCVPCIRLHFVAIAKNAESASVPGPFIGLQET